MKHQIITLSLIYLLSSAALYSMNNDINPTARPDQTKPVTSSSSGAVQAEPETPSTSGSSSLSSSTDSYFDLNLSDIDSGDDAALQAVAGKLRSLFYTPQKRQQLIDAIETKIQRDNNEQ